MPESKIRVSIGAPQEWLDVQVTGAGVGATDDQKKAAIKAALTAGNILDDMADYFYFGLGNASKGGSLSLRVTW